MQEESGLKAKVRSDEMSVYNVHGGHSLVCRGASGLLDEVNEDRKVKNKVIELLRAEGHTVYDCTDDVGINKNQNLRNIVAKCNAHKVDLDISIHLNAGGGTGCEVENYNSNTKAISDRICSNISSALGIANRGTKYMPGLYVLEHTKAPAILVECCFVDNATDNTVWNVYKCAKAIVEGILGKSIGSSSTTQGWQKNSVGWWYTNADGSYPSNSWQNIDGKWYYFDEKGYAICNTWKKINNHWYYFKDNCSMAVGWCKVDNIWYYLSPSNTEEYPIGSMMTGWIQIDEYWYYLNPVPDGSKGTMVHGWQTINGNKYYFLPESLNGKPEGSMATGWCKIDGAWYCFNTTYNCQPVGSVLVNHWLTDGDKKYYLKDDGKMAYGETLEIGGERFNFDESGVKK